MFHRLTGGHIGIVSTAYIADATPAALVSHTRNRGAYEAIVDQYLNGVQNYTWTDVPIDVIFGGGAEQFYPPSLGGKTYMGKNYYDEFAKKDYQIIQNRTALQSLDVNEKALGIFSVSNMAKWLDRNVYRQNLNQSLSPAGDKKPALDQPGLKDMTLKAIDILQARSRDNGDKGWLLMSESANIDKMMHALDYDRALGELLELDDTVKATIAHLNATNSLKETLILVTADHGHGFDVMGSVDTHYLAAQNTDRKKRDAIGTYEQSGLSGYVNTGNLTYTDSNFPSVSYHLHLQSSRTRANLVSAELGPPIFFIPGSHSQSRSPGKLVCTQGWTACGRDSSERHLRLLRQPQGCAERYHAQRYPTRGE
jgi:alkaline phosphatase